MTGVTRWFAVGILVAFVAACSQHSPTPEVRGGPEVVAQLGGGLFLGRPVSTGNLTVWPIYPKTEPADPGDFVTLEQAQADKLAEVREVGAATTANDLIPDINVPSALESEGTEGLAQQLVQSLGSARVDTLVIENKGDKPILVLAGTVVKGGKQDRQIGQDFVIQAGATVPVDAFCVEQGRWTASRGGVATDGLFLASNGLAPKDVRKHLYDKDQSKVWQEVAATRMTVFAARGASSVASAPASDVDAGTNVDDAQAETTGFGVTNFGISAWQAGSSLVQALEVTPDPNDATLRTVRDTWIALIDSKHPPVGFAYAINGKPEAARAFAHSKIFRAHLDSLAMSIAFEARLARTADEAAKREKQAPVCDAKTMAKFLSSIDGASVEEQKTRAANINKTRRHEVGYGNDCVLAVAGKSLVLTRDWTAK